MGGGGEEARIKSSVNDLTGIEEDDDPLPHPHILVGNNTANDLDEDVDCNDK